MNAPVNLEKHLIEVPPVAWSRTTMTQVVGISLTELEAPFSDSLIGEGDSAYGHHLFNVAEAQREAEIEPDTMTDDLSGKPVATIQRRRDIHQLIMLQPPLSCTICWLT